jgi:deferrochelatase/peroxidase EfeB
VQNALHKLPKGSFHVVQEHYGFKYKDGRDLSGFIDGTMNPATPA